MLFLTCSWRFLRSNKLEQLEFKLEKIIGIQKLAGKVRKTKLLQLKPHPFICMKNFINKKVGNRIGMLIQDQFGIIQNLQSPIPQTSFLVGTFFAVSYSKTALVTISMTLYGNYEGKKAQKFSTLLPFYSQTESPKCLVGNEVKSIRK